MGLIEDLSAAFVAFTIEVDDTSESRRPAGAKGPWLVSLAMSRNCMQWLPPEGLAAGELLARARTPTDLNGMLRWGYVEVEGMARGRPGVVRPGAIVRPTARGTRAQRVWEGTPEEVEARWAERFGSRAADLRAALADLAGELDPGLPDTMPIVRHGWSTRREDEPERPPGPGEVTDLGLDSLLARPLTAFALEFEATGKLSFALHAALLPVLGDAPMPLRDLQDATGIHRAQIDNAAGYLEKAGLAAVVAAPGGKRGKAIALTADGARAKAGGERKRAVQEAAWDERHRGTLERVRPILAALSPHLIEIEHPPGTWRSESRHPARLPRFPLVTHRGGFPDGA